MILGKLFMQRSDASAVTIDRSIQKIDSPAVYVEAISLESLVAKATEGRVSPDITTIDFQSPKVAVLQADNVPYLQGDNPQDNFRIYLLDVESGDPKTAHSVIVARGLRRAEVKTLFEEFGALTQLPRPKVASDLASAPDAARP